MISVLHVHGGGVEVMGWGGGRGVYMCTSVIMARAARSHRSEAGRPLLSLLLGGRGRGDAARGDADVLLDALGVIAEHVRYARDMFVPVFISASK